MAGEIVRIHVYKADGHLGRVFPLLQDNEYSQFALNRTARIVQPALRKADVDLKHVSDRPPRS